MATDRLEFARPSRRPVALAMVGGALAILLVLIFAVNAHPLIVTVFALLIAPAIWDVWRGAEATLRVDDDGIHWTTGARRAEAPWEAIDEVVLATTLDFSQRASLRLSDGGRMRIPPECLPGGRVLDQVLEARGIRHRRSLFSF
ncbi:MAG: hypothetical protein AAFY77_11570 [Pseudomonadota bacterium]